MRLALCCVQEQHPYNPEFVGIAMSLTENVEVTNERERLLRLALKDEPDTPMKDEIIRRKLYNAFYSDREIMRKDTIRTKGTEEEKAELESEAARPAKRARVSADATRRNKALKDAFKALATDGVHAASVCSDDLVSKGLMSDCEEEQYEHDGEEHKR